MKFGFLRMVGCGFVAFCACLSPSAQGGQFTIIEGPDARRGSVLSHVSSALSASDAALEAHGYTSPNIKVFLSGDANWLTESYLAAMGLSDRYRAGKLDTFGRCDPLGEFGKAAIFLCEEHEVWERRRGATRIVAHEVWHAAVQDGIVQKPCCFDSNAMSLYGPEWLVEGSAEVFAEYVLAGRNPSRFARAMESFTREAPRDVDLAKLKSRRGFRNNNGWRVGPAAVYELINGTNFEKLFDYYEHIANGDSIDMAFSSAFGQDQASFAAYFATGNTSRSGCAGWQVGHGDRRLGDVAENALGDRSRWPEIAELNGITAENPHRLGQCLKLPG